MENKRHITIKIWRQTLRKLRFLRAYTGNTLVATIDSLVTRELEKEKKKDKS